VPDVPRLVIVGGGITGLAAAHAALEAGAHVTLLEESDRLGGKIRTDDVAGLPVEAGPDAFLARVPWAADLCRRLGLADDLVSPAAGSAYVWARGRLRRLPDGLVLGVPARAIPLARSGILSAAGVLRAGLDLVLPAGDRTGDVAVGKLVRHRLGDEVHERLVDPLVGGINAGDTDRLSLEASVPQLAAVANRHRSLVLGLRAQRRAAPPDPAAPVFWSLAGGLGRLIDALAAHLERSERADVRLGAPVEALEPATAGWRVTAGGSAEPGGSGDAAEIAADAVILAVPADAAARLLAPLSPRAADLARSVDHASVAVVAMVFPVSAVARPLDASGYLVPRREGMLMTACSWASSKWAYLARPDRVVLRVSAGRHGDERALTLGDGALVDRLLGEVDRTMGIAGDPVATRVNRWPRSFPQYAPGHLARVAELESALAEDTPGLRVAGAGYRGIGIPACVQQGEAAVAAALADRE